MVYLLNDDNCWFPSAQLADKYGLLAVGGDLSSERLIVAYAGGIFPWYNSEEPLLWWSLDPRFIILPGEMKVSHSLRHVINSGKFECRIDTDFRSVMTHCAMTPRKSQSGTWIHDEMVEAYCRLHEMGIAHSFETYCDGALVGGLYGVSLGKVFFGESMFHQMSDASKFAFYNLHRFLSEYDFKLIDCQQETKHLASLGAFPVPRSVFLRELSKLVSEPTLLGNWGNGNWKLMYLKTTQPEEVRFRAINHDEDIALDE